ncbi:MAG: isoamylase early set domain-containing protein [bacterium]
MIIKKTDGSVTFEFDQNTAGKVYLAGDFNNWNYSATPLKKTPKGTYRVTLHLKPGNYQFRYFANHNWYNDNNADGLVNNNYGSQNSIVVVE